MTLAHNKLILNGPPDDDAAIAESFDAVWASADVREGAAARAEKRTPKFEGTLMASPIYRVLDAHVIHGRADNLAIEDEHGTMSYAELLHESASVAGSFISSASGRVGCSDRPGTGRELVVAVLACTRIGARPEPIADFRLAGSRRCFIPPETEVPWDLLIKAARIDPAPAPRRTPRAMRR